MPRESGKWCSVGEGGSGYFWGSHGCTIGNHVEDPHIHECESPESWDDDGNPVGSLICSRIDDRTGMVAWSDDPDNFDYDYGLGWWQGGTVDDREGTAVFVELTEGQSNNLGTAGGE